MTNVVRGRVLIINIMNFRNPGPEKYTKRTGSDVDYRNLCRMFKDLRFDVAKTQAQLTDLTAEVLLYL